MKLHKVLFSFALCSICMLAFSSIAISGSDILQGKWILSVEDTLTAIQQSQPSMSSSDLAQIKTLLEQKQQTEFSFDFDLDAMVIKETFDGKTLNNPFAIIKSEGNIFTVSIINQQGIIEIKDNKLFLNLNSSFPIAFKKEY